MKSALVMIVLLFATGRGWAFQTGKDFLKECEPSTQKVFSQLSNQEQLLGMSCGGYFQGFVGAIRVAEAGKPKMLCSPPDIEIRQALKVAVKWMNEHAETLDRSAAELIFLALVDAFPCSRPGAPPKENKENEGTDHLKL